MTILNHNSLTLNGVEYIRKDSCATTSFEMSKDKMCIFRCRNAGVHAGQKGITEDGFMEILNSRRLWKWCSKATLSELAVFGPVNVGDNKYGCVVPSLKLNVSDVCEIIECSESAAVGICSVAEWKAS